MTPFCQIFIVCNKTALALAATLSSRGIPSVIIKTVSAKDLSIPLVNDKTSCYEVLYNRFWLYIIYLLYFLSRTTGLALFDLYLPHGRCFRDLFQPLCPDLLYTIIDDGIDTLAIQPSHTLAVDFQNIKSYYTFVEYSQISYPLRKLNVNHIFSMNDLIDYSPINNNKLQLLGISYIRSSLLLIESPGVEIVCKHIASLSFNHFLLKLHPNPIKRHSYQTDFSFEEFTFSVEATTHLFRDSTFVIGRSFLLVFVLMQMHPSCIIYTYPEIIDNIDFSCLSCEIFFDYIFNDSVLSIRRK